MRVVTGLQRLEYRGYDSWGVAFPLNNKIETFKSIEPLIHTDSGSLDFEVEYALGHTRWATHGAVNLTNCHPHRSQCGHFALVHNGIVENFQALKSDLIEQGIRFISDTDTELIVRLIEQQLKSLNKSSNNMDVRDHQIAFQQAFAMLEGSNTLVLISAEKKLLLGIRHGSPLIAGKRDKGIFLASDYYSFAEHTQNCLLIDDQQMIICTDQQVELYDLKTKQYVETIWQDLPVNEQLLSSHKQDNNGFEHYMLKEVNEQWQTLINATQLNPELLCSLVSAMGNANHIYLTGAGAAYFIAEQISHILRDIAEINSTPIPAYEYQNYLAQMQSGDVLLAVSQSGETADTLRFIQHAKNKQVLIASIVNMPGAMMTRLSDFPFYSHCGAEICVLSTKTSTAQLVFGYLLAHSFIDQLSLAKQHIQTMSQQLTHYLSQDSVQDFAELARKITGEHIYLLGRGKFLGTGKIGALNIKEASYLHAEAFSAGELKHGVIALITEGTPVICFVDNHNQDYMVSIASEVKARGGLIIGICQSPNPIFDHLLMLPAADNPAAVIGSIIPCQLLAYFLATQRGLNPDKPRNLAKSVTVI